jgi:signal transduction histidine kinase
MKNLFGRIYVKLYLSFVVIFLLTLLLTALLSSSFYGSRIRGDVADFFESQARFVRQEFLRNCDPDLQAAGCSAFLKNLSEISQLRFWVLDPEGKLLATKLHEKPPATAEEVQRAVSGELVTSFTRGKSPFMVVPVRGKSGRINALIVLQRTMFSRPPRYPFLLFLTLAALVLGLLILPVSYRITKPLRQLHRLGEEWAAGHLQKRADATGHDEIAELAGVFNLMAENLEEMLQQRKEFLAFISHELKSPLARIKVALEMLAERNPGDPESAHLLQGMEKDLSESESLIEQLLVLSRIEMQLPTMEPQEVDAAELVRKASGSLQPLVSAAGIRMTQEGELRALVRGSAELLQRAFANILENAVKFSPQGGEVRTLIRSMPQAVELQFLDQGAGIELEECEKVFEPFYRGKSSGNRQGSGLGLFLARRIIDLHGGTITASPNQPSGARITIVIPSVLAKSAQATERLSSSAADIRGN